MTEQEIVEWIWERSERKLQRDHNNLKMMIRAPTEPKHRWLHAQARNVLLSVIVDCPLSALTPSVLIAMRIAVQRPWFRSGLPTGWFPRGLPPQWPRDRGFDRGVPS